MSVTKAIDGAIVRKTEISCPGRKCKKTIEIPHSKLGHKVRCPDCKQSFVFDPKKMHT